jgi:fumarylacetoacetase
MITLDETHAPSRRSWVASANGDATPFPIQNLPLGIFEDDSHGPRAGVAIGDRIVDLSHLFEKGLLPDVVELAPACSESTLDSLMARGRAAAVALRRAVSRLLVEDAARQGETAQALVPMEAVRMRLPASIGDFTDFFTSIHHAERGIRLNRPGAPPLFPNFKHLPVAYHGRASSVAVSGTPCVRPRGQLGAACEEAGPQAPSRYGASERMDFELEVGAFIGRGNALGTAIPLADADRHIFGLCLVNDWSARDIQRWESQPLGPFLAKSFHTAVSPWVVTLEALEPFRSPHGARMPGDPELNAHLDSADNRERGAFDIELDVTHVTQAGVHTRLTTVNFNSQYWTVGQMLAHHASNGCNLRSGDLLASGTVSERDPRRAGCLLELTEDGRSPLALNDGSRRAYLEDGDEIVMRGWCRRDGFRAIGFGDLRGRIHPALPLTA